MGSTSRWLAVRFHQLLRQHLFVLGTDTPAQLGLPLCWLRDATFTLFALMDNGFHKKATDWRTERAIARVDWLNSFA